MNSLDAAASEVAVVDHYIGYGAPTAAEENETASEQGLCLLECIEERIVEVETAATSAFGQMKIDYGHFEGLLSWGHPEVAETVGMIASVYKDP